MKSVWLRQLEIEHFGPFRKKVFSFKKGMNLVFGGNGSGKTCLASMVPKILFGPVGCRSENSTESGHGRLGMIIDHAEGQARISRDIASSRVDVELFGKDGTLQRRIEGGPQESNSAGNGENANQEYFHWLGELFGMEDRGKGFFNVFTVAKVESGSPTAMKIALELTSGAMIGNSLAWLRQTGLEDSQAGPKGTDEAGAKELARIQGRLRELEKEWFDLKTRIDEWPAHPSETVDAENESKPFPEQSQDGQERSAKKKEGDEGLLPQSSALTQGSNSKSLLPEHDAEIADLLESRETVRRQISKTGIPFDPPPSLTSILRDASAIRQQLVEAQNQAREIQSNVSLLKKPGFPKPLLFSAVVVAAAAAGCWSWPKFSIYCVLSATALLAGAWTWYWRKLTAYNKRRFEWRSRQDEVDREIEKIKARQEQLEPRFLQIGLSPSAVDMVKMEKNLPKHLELRDQLKIIEGRLRDLGHDPADEEVNVAAADDGGEPGIAENSVPADGGNEVRPSSESSENMSPADQREDLQSRLKEIEAEGEGLHRQESLLAKRLDYGRGQRDAMVQCGPFKSILENSETLDHSNQDISKLVKEVTGGQFIAARFNRNLELELLSEAGTWVKQDQLSEGIFSAVDLIIKLAGACLARGRTFPWLIFDEPLESLDPRRSDLVLKLLEKASRNHQVLLTSRDPHLKSKSRAGRWHLLDLDEPEITIPEERKEEDVEQLHLL